MTTNVAIVSDDDNEYQRELSQFEARFSGMAVKDDQTAEQVLLFITECKGSCKRLDERREALVKPHLDEQRKINNLFNPVIKGFEALWRAADQRVSDYRKKKQAAIEEANRKAIAEAEAIRQEKERKEREAREEAERLRKEAERIEAERLEQEYQAELARLELERKRKEEQAAAEAARRAGDEQAAREADARAKAAKAAEEEQARKAEEDRKAAEAEKARLEKQAVKLDAKADQAEMQALMTSPVLQSGMANVHALSNGAKAFGKKVDVWMFTNGMPIDGEYYKDDPRVKDIPDRYFVLDTSKLGKDVKNGVPVPGTLKDFKYTTASRTAK